MGTVRKLVCLIVIGYCTANAQAARADGFFETEEALAIGAHIDSNLCPGKRCAISLPGSGTKVTIVRLDLSDSAAACEAEKTNLCGSSGCGKAILAKIDGSWRILMESRNFKYMTTKSNGFRDVAITVREFPNSGPPKEVAQVYVWSGTRYQPRK